MIKFLVQIALCFFTFASLLFAFVQQNNELMIVRQKVVDKRLKFKELQEEVVRKEVGMAKFSAPSHLLNLLQEKPFSHLVFSKETEVVVIGHDQDP